MAGPFWEKYGETTLTAENSLVDFEQRFRALVTSVDRYKMRPANNDLLVSLKNEEDFFAVVRAASGVNIRLEVGWLFEPGQSKQARIDRCFLRMQLSNGCIDERLNLFLHDLAIQKHS